MNILIIGASRGIGLEFVRQYRQAGDRVIATARSDEGLGKITALGAKALRVDVAETASVSELTSMLDGEKLDLAIYNAGVANRDGSLSPPTQQSFDAIMHTNVLGAMQVIPQVAPLVEAARGKFAFISSQLACIGQADSSLAWVYRASKSALNMTVASARHDYPLATFLALSPGWVQTDMGGAQAPLTVEQSVAAMRSTLLFAQSQDSGKFLQHDGNAFPSW
jgi:NAD(P)-dependent dehydrogenase (short-subunit alcohol dehydrogenase family)